MKKQLATGLLVNGKPGINGYGCLEISSECEIDLICSVNSSFDLLNTGGKKKKREGGKENEK